MLNESLPNSEENSAFGFALSEASQTTEAASPTDPENQDKAILVHLYLGQHKDVENLLEFKRWQNLPVSKCWQRLPPAAKVRISNIMWGKAKRRELPKR
ncbi:TPA: hypothetical protein PW551_001053 [Mannheimia haemolytica]|nr:hypothetical protein [Mannheimia haemolytica]